MVAASSDFYKLSLETLLNKCTAFICLGSTTCIAMNIHIYPIIKHNLSLPFSKLLRNGNSTSSCTLTKIMNPSQPLVFYWSLANNGLFKFQSLKNTWHSFSLPHAHYHRRKLTENTDFRYCSTSLKIFWQNAHSSFSFLAQNMQNLIQAFVTNVKRFNDHRINQVRKDLRDHRIQLLNIWLILQPYGAHRRTSFWLMQQ